MFDLSTVALASAGVLLSILLYRLVMHRLDGEGAQIRARGLQHSSMPLHSSLFTKVEHVRHDLASPHSSNVSQVRKSRRLMLISAARGAIRGLQFFRTREYEHEN